MKSHRLCAMSLAALLASGCAHVPGIQPTLRMLALDDAAEPADRDASEGIWQRSDWWRELGDQQLSGLIEQALQSNPDLQAAQARFERAGAIAAMSRTTLWPRLDLDGSITRTRFSENGEIPPPFAGSAATVNDAAVEGVWGLDFFGRNRQALQAALGSARAAAAEQQAVRILLASEVARHYVDLARLLAQRDLLRGYIGQQDELQALLRRRHENGIDPRNDLDETSARLKESNRAIAALAAEIDLGRHALAVLLGKPPEALQSLDARQPASTTLSLPARLPADLLGHRPDVVASRWRVEAARHQLAATRAEFYPNVDLRAFTGYSSIGTLGNWLESGSRQSGIGLAFSLPLFNAGELRSAYRARNAETELAIAEYNATLLDALREAADTLSGLYSITQQLEHQQAAFDSSRHALSLSERRYAAGVGNRLEVLEAKAVLYARQQRLVDLQAQLLDARIRLIHALGGGYAEDPHVATSYPVARQGSR